MPDHTSARKPRSRLARFGLVLAAIGLILTGALLVILGSSGLFTLDAVGLPAETPGLIVVALGVFTLFRSGRQITDDGQDHDPESHLAFTRDVRDDLDRLHDDDWDDD
jgi:hypothetical protein